jgi:hypothetical protein
MIHKSSKARAMIDWRSSLHTILAKRISSLSNRWIRLAPHPLRSKRISFPTIYLFLHFSNSGLPQRIFSRAAFNFNRTFHPFQATSCTLTRQPRLGTTA